MPNVPTRLRHCNCKKDRLALATIHIWFLEVPLTVAWHVAATGTAEAKRGEPVYYPAVHRVASGREPCRSEAEAIATGPRMSLGQSSDEELGSWRFGSLQHWLHYYSAAQTATVYYGCCVSVVVNHSLQLQLVPITVANSHTHTHTVEITLSHSLPNRSLKIFSEPPHLLRGPDGSKRTIGGCNRASCVKELAEVKSWLAKSRATRSSVAKSTASACEWVWSSGTGSRCRLEDRYSSPSSPAWQRCHLTPCQYSVWTETIEGPPTGETTSYPA